MQVEREVREAAAVEGARPLRILTVLAYYHPHWTGLTMFARRIAEGLVAGGAEVTVLCSRHDPALANDEVIAGVRVVRLVTAGHVSRTPLMPAFPRALGRLIRDHDVVHLHSPMAEAGAVAVACRRAGVPLVVTHQGDVVMPDGAVNQAIQRVMGAVLRSTFRSADRVVTHNDDYAQASMVAVAGDRAGAISPPVVFAPAPPDAVEAFRHRHGLDGRPVVAFAGRWVEEKGFDVLLRAAPAVLAARPDTVFVFAGELDVVYETFSERCAPLRRALGAALVEVGLLLDSVELAAFYGAADVFVLPSRSDCLAAVQVEALVCGTPLVASDIPGARSVIRTTGAGLLVPPEDEAALADAIIGVLADPDRFADAVAAAPAHYDPELALVRYRELFDDVVAHPRHRVRSTAPVAVATGARTALGSDAEDAVDRLLAAELDPAYRRRVRWLLARLPTHPVDAPDDGFGSVGAADRPIRVLDAGTGLGNVAHVTEQARPDVVLVGLDRDGDRLGRAAADGVTAPLLRGDLGALPHPDATFDAILCSEVLEHLDDDAAAVAELARVLRPGGRLLVSVPHADYPWTWDPIDRALESLGRRPIRSGPLVGIWTNHVRLYRAPQLARLLAGAGLDVVAVEPQTHHALPFTHLALYGVGRALVERELLPAAARASVSRHQDAAGGPTPPSGALGLVHRALRRADRRNDALPAGTRTFVGLVAEARRPIASRVDAPAAAPAAARVAALVDPPAAPPLGGSPS